MQTNDSKAKQSDASQLSTQLQIDQTLHSWVEISRAKIIQNIQNIKQQLGQTSLGVIIKGNAYGHGIVQIVQILQQVPEVDWVIAFSLTEALIARRAGFTKPILVCGYADGAIEEAILNQIDLVLHDYASLERYQKAAQKLQKTLNVHLKVDTGLNRLGFRPNEALLLAVELQKSKQLCLRGLFSHFSESEAADNWYAKEQLIKFDLLLQELLALNIQIPIVHLANTVAIFRLPAAYKSLVRSGGGVYGLRKKIAHNLIANSYHELQTALTWKSRIIQIRLVSAGSYISYGTSFKASSELKIATIPVGYADGYDRDLSNNSVIYVNGMLAPVVGRVCMNLTMLDVTHVPNLQVGDEVILLGDYDGVRVDDLMLRLNTIACDVTTRINWTISRFIV